VWATIAADEVQRAEDATLGELAGEWRTSGGMRKDGNPVADENGIARALRSVAKWR
jgi:hypothetical protein